jgi:polyferredoxin
VLHDRNPEYVRLSDGGIRNAYTIRILNKHGDRRRFAIAIEGVPGATLGVVGAEQESGGAAVAEVGPDQSRELRAVVSLAGRPAAASVPIAFVITDEASGESVRGTDNFRGPAVAGGK